MAAAVPGKPHSRIRVPGLAALSLLGLFVGCSGEDKPHGAKPNVLLISVCSVRPDHMSCYGYVRDTTPNMTKFASESIVFDNAITQWPKTTPGFAAIMSAKYGHANGVLRTTHGPRLADEHVTLAEALSQAGYATAAFVSSPALAAHSNIAQQGSEVVEEVFRDPRRHHLPTERALRWLRNRDPSKPFFVWAHYNNAHYPYRGGGAPNPDMFVGDEHYDASRQIRAITTRGARLALPVPPDHPCRLEAVRPDIGAVHRWAVLRERPNEYAFYIARYDAGIYGADAAIGTLLDGVRDMGLWENTIIALVGDHGESLGDHNYYFEHGRFPYDATARVPMMIRPPDGVAQRRIDAPVATFALAPTILEMAGIQPPADWQARSLAGLMNGGVGPEFVFSEAGYHMEYMLTVRDNDWKLIHVPNEMDGRLMRGTEYELYNWRDDPHELKNLVTTHPEQVTRLARVLKEWSAPWVDVAYRQAQRRHVEVDEQTRRQLATLGYVDDADEEDDEDDEK
ncbi:MAG TPA: sulfatase [Phycisphaerae bacterium]|nr:sulfatase [Phycisphaerae bacterium]